MMGYKDRTWCPADISTRCSRAAGCDRVFTMDTHQAATRWWGNENYPAVCFAGRPECLEEALK